MRALAIVFLLIVLGSPWQIVSAQELDPRAARELDLAERSLNAGRTGRARVALRRSLARTPSARGSALALRLLPQLPAATRPSERAREDARWILDALQSLDSPAVERTRGWALAILGRHGDAIDAVRIRAQEHASADRLQQMAALFVTRDALQDAERAMGRALRILPQSRELQLALASLHMARGRPEHAIRGLLGVLALDPNDHVARRDLAGAYMAAGRHEEAMTTLRELARTSEDPSDELLLADAALELGRHAIAEQAARRAIAAGATSGHSTLALALAAQGRRTEATQALQHAPDDARSRRARRVLGENEQ